MTSKHLLRTAVAAGIALAAQDAAADWSNVYAMAPLRQLHHAALTDNFYTVSAFDAEAAPGCCGYAPATLAAWVPFEMTASTPPTYNDWARAPLKRFWKGAPQTEHFYTTSQTDADFVMAQGYSPEGHEGALFGGAYAQTVPMYRLNRWNPSTNDLIHAYTISTAERNAYQQQGWGYDGVQGYAMEVPPIQSSGASWAADDLRRVHIVIPMLSNGGMSDNPANRRCVGRVEYDLKGSRGVITDWTFGTLPGSISMQGCYSTVSIGTVARRVNTPLRIEFGGAFGVYRDEYNRVSYLKKAPISMRTSVYIY